MSHFVFWIPDLSQIPVISQVSNSHSECKQFDSVHTSLKSPCIQVPILVPVEIPGRTTVPWSMLGISVACQALTHV